MAVGRAPYGLLALVLLLPACLASLTFECVDDAACVLDEKQGSCLAPGRCAYPDVACESLLRFGPAAGPELASTCVEPGATTGVQEVTTSSTTTTDCGPCVPTLGECRDPQAACVDGECVEVLLPEGSPCREDDPCIVAAACDAAGECIVEQEVECADPPGLCHESQGTCGTDGTCSYAPRSVDAPCEDGDGCTLEDACDGRGTCVAGPICPTANVCAAGTCSGEQCSFFPVVDGASCGPAPADLCCAGACIDASTDAEHCGSCEGACPAEQLCVPMGTTGMCMPTSNAGSMPH